jgi:Triosephosphate isomerase
LGLEERLGTEGREVRILYGGSVNPSNAHDILALPEVGGALVGDGSLKAAEFDGIVDAVPKSSRPSLAERKVTPLIRIPPANVSCPRHEVVLNRKESGLY